MSPVSSWFGGSPTKTMDTESLKSGYNSELNCGSPRVISHGHGHGHSQGHTGHDRAHGGHHGGGNGLNYNTGGSGSSISLTLPGRHHHSHNNHHNNRHRSHRSHRSLKSGRREEPLLETPESGHDHDHDSEVMDRNMGNLLDSSSTRGILRDGAELLEVQILPNQMQMGDDDRWGDNATAVTGNTSDRSNSPSGINGTGGNSSKWATNTGADEELPDNLGFCQRYIGSAAGAAVVAIAIASPILMVVGHRFGFMSSRPVVTIRECHECHAFLLTLSIKLFALLGAIWAIFWRAPPATMPRMFFFRAVTLLLSFLATFTFWLFYWVKAEEEGAMSIIGATTFASGLVDSLLAIHYLGVLLIEVRHMSPQFQIQVVRSPDGVSKHWTIGELSIQRAAVWILQHYYAEFPSYNPHLDRLPPLRKRHPSFSTGGGNGSSFKFYEFDGVTSSFNATRLSRRGLSHNERFYEEHEYERRVRKRRGRLIVSTEEAFAHIKRLQDEQGPAVPLDSVEAAAAVFPSLARPLQKYLRVTRQQPWHTAESVLHHLATCLRLGLSPKAFLDRYLSFQAVLQASREGDVSSWALVSDLSVSRSITKDTKFLLRNGDVSLLVQVSALPHFNLTEQVVDPKSNKFTLRLSSETSV